MGVLGRDAILGANDLEYAVVEVPEWGGQVRVRMMTGAERDAFEAATVTRQGKKVSVNMVNMRARLVALTAVDEQGERLFSESDVEALAKKSGAALGRVFEAAQKLNGLTEGAGEEAAANFQIDLNGASTSG